MLSLKVFDSEIEHKRNILASFFQLEETSQASWEQIYKTLFPELKMDHTTLCLFDTNWCFIWYA